MKNNTRELLESISNLIYMQQSSYKYAQKPIDNEEYVKGCQLSLDWLDKVTNRYLDNEKNLLIDFKSIISQQKVKIEMMKDSDKKKGLLFEIKKIEGQL
jgi:hypothetical protein